MTHRVWTASRGIFKQPDLLDFLVEQPLTDASFKKITRGSQARKSDLVVGWGNKSNTQPARAFSQKHQLSYLSLEDGFLSYAGHPSYDSHRLSLILDRKGIYYDSRQPSDLEDICQSVSEWYTEEHESRSRNLIQRITTHGLSKYNHPRTNIESKLASRKNSFKNSGKENPPVLLLIDQVANDLSVAGAQANAASFQEMLDQALNFHPDATIFLKTHPDVMKGKKQGYFSQNQRQDSRVQLLTDDYKIPDLMQLVTHVFCVSSQLGFEALLYGKEVHCFGIPFYAGWGLTDDTQQCDRRTQTLTLEQLVAAALIEYPKYRHSVTGRPCEVEEVVDLLIERSQRKDYVRVDRCYAVGFSLWKRSFVKLFVGDMAKEVRYLPNTKSLVKKIEQYQGRCSVLIWGDQDVNLEPTLKSKGVNLWRMEDGFIRSIGLGADLRRPSCLVIDGQGLYYNSARPSDIIDLCEQFKTNPMSTEKGSGVMNFLTQSGLTKYNVGSDDASSDSGWLDSIKAVSGTKEIILVPGQYEQDKSLELSRGTIKTNHDLLVETRAAYPDAFIIYKEHPDLYSGVRPGALGEQRALGVADLYLAHVSMHHVLNQVDRVSTMTSLTGFEALIRGKEVTVWGSPFYAGWGLTEDKVSLPERTNRLTIEELVYVTFYLYCRCLSWQSRSLVSVETLIKELARDKEMAKQPSLNSFWLTRQIRKLGYLVESFLN